MVVGGSAPDLGGGCNHQSSPHNLLPSGALVVWSSSGGKFQHVYNLVFLRERKRERERGRESGGGEGNRIKKNLKEREKKQWRRER
jgi:hypothetical protein